MKRNLSGLQAEWVNLLLPKPIVPKAHLKKLFSSLEISLVTISTKGNGDKSDSLYKSEELRVCLALKLEMRFLTAEHTSLGSVSKNSQPMLHLPSMIETQMC